MKKILNILLFISMVFSILEAKKFGQCTTKADALNMMIATQAYSNKLLRDFRNLSAANKSEETNKLSDFIGQYHKDSQFYNKLIIDEKYQEACDKFIALAKQYHFDIEKNSKSSLKVDSSKNHSSCKPEEASIVLMFLIKKTSHNMIQNLTSQLNTLGSDMIQNPNLACKKIKKLASSMGESYDTLLKRAKVRIHTSKEVSDAAAKIEEKNAKNNHVCTKMMAKNLLLDRHEFRDKIDNISRFWREESRAVSHISGADIKLLRFLNKKMLDINKIANKFSDDFIAIVEVNINDGHYDKACETYKQLTAKYTTTIEKLKHEYKTFTQSKPKNVPYTGM